MSDKWFYARKGGERSGPVTEDEIRRLALSGELRPTDLAWKEGMPDWVPVSESGILPVTPAPSPSQPWDPDAIFFFSILFGPVWLGIMGALNARRLQMRLRVLPAITCVVGATILAALLWGYVVRSNSLGISTFLLGSIFLRSIIAAGFLVLQFVVALVAYGTSSGYWDSQTGHFNRYRKSGGREAGWLVPSVGGSAWTILVLLVVFAAPALPALTPRAVCQRFANAASLNEAKKCTTTDLWPVLAARDAFREGPGADAGFSETLELTQDADSPDGNGRRVGYVLYWQQKGKAATIEGFFHVVDDGGWWRLKQWGCTSFNNQRIPAGLGVISDGRDYQELLQRFLSPANTRKPWRDVTFGEMLQRAVGQWTPRDVLEWFAGCLGGVTGWAREHWIELSLATITLAIGFLAVRWVSFVRRRNGSKKAS